MSTKLLAIVRENLKSKISERDALTKERDVRQTEADALVSAAEKEVRDLDPKESARFRELRSQITAIDVDVAALASEIEDLQTRETELRDNIEARENAEKAAAEWAARADTADAVQTVAKVRSEARTYNPDSERRGLSFFRDVLARKDSPEAAERVDRHVREARLHELAGYEARDVGTSAFAGITVPQYLTDMVAPVARAMAPTVAICNRHSLPDKGMTIEISRITTGTAVAEQSSQGDAVQETDADDTTLSVPVRTYSGQQDVSRQALERSTGVDGLLAQDLANAYWTKLDAAILAGAGTNGTHLGITATSSIIAVTYTDSTPTFAESYPKFADLIQQVQSGVFMGVSHLIMHPRRFWWFAKELGTSTPLLTVPGAGNQQVGTVGNTAYMGGGRSLLGVDVVLDGNIPKTLGAGTNEDIILGVTAGELHLWHDDGAPLFIRAEDAAAGTLQVKFVVYGYSAFTAGRYPGAHGTIGGTGLAAPSF